MAMKYCPACGAPNLDNGNTCPACGEELRDRTLRTDGEAQKIAVTEVASVPDTPAMNGGKRTLFRPKILVPAAVAAVVVLTLVLVLVLSSGGKHLELPYGIRIDQNAREIDYILQENGYVLETKFGTDMVIYGYRDRIMYDYLAEPQITEYKKTGTRYLSFVYTDDQGDKENPSAKFNHVREELIRLYGQPNGNGNRWQEKNLDMSLFYTDNGNFHVCFYMYMPSDNKQ